MYVDAYSAQPTHYPTGGVSVMPNPLFPERHSASASASVMLLTFLEKRCSIHDKWPPA